ncbi:MAG: hypothetical protein H7A44_11440 [Opitutaceae bacterium]|jgi:hypothetical protein|nr:hypothetical protein [Opitutaceae bacterium]
MPLLRLLLGAAVAVVAVFAGLFAALIVACTAVVGYLALLITGRRRGRPAPGHSPTRGPGPRPTAGRGDAIDIEASEVGETADKTLER